MHFSLPILFWKLSIREKGGKAYPFIFLRTVEKHLPLGNWGLASISDILEFHKSDVLQTDLSLVGNKSVLFSEIDASLISSRMNPHGSRILSLLGHLTCPEVILL